MAPQPDFQAVSPTTLADLLGRAQVMDIGIRPLWPRMPRIAGSAYTVRCAAGDNLMLHAAIHRAEPGSVVVVEAGDSDFAMAGGNVCAVAQRNGIAAFVIDGVIRDRQQVREMGFPVFARGVIPIPGTKAHVLPMNEPVDCGGVRVNPGDVVVGDEEGVVVVPVDGAARVFAAAVAREASEIGQSLDEWEAAHRSKIDKILREQGFKSGV